MDAINSCGGLETMSSDDFLKEALQTTRDRNSVMLLVHCVF